MHQNYKREVFKLRTYSWFVKQHLLEVQTLGSDKCTCMSDYGAGTEIKVSSLPTS